MPFLTLNGYTFKVVDSSPKRKIRARGSRSRSARGQMRDGGRGRRREWTLRACFEDHDLAESMIRTINGEGHLIRFVEGWDAATGLGPEIAFLDGTNFNLSAAGPFPGFSSGALESDGGGPKFDYDAQLESEWTIHGWYQIDGESWAVRTIRDDGGSWEDGVRDDSSWSTAWGNWEFRVQSGRVRARGLGADLTRLRHLAILPYRVHETMITAWHAATKPWGSLPLLRMEGDIIATDHEFVVGEVTSVDVVEKPSSVAGFGWVNNAETIDFRLVEYATGFLSDPDVP